VTTEDYAKAVQAVSCIPWLEPSYGKMCSSNSSSGSSSTVLVVVVVAAAVVVVAAAAAVVVVAVAVVVAAAAVDNLLYKAFLWRLVFDSMSMFQQYC